MLLYSTCTFSPEENEQTIEYLLQEYPEFKICEMEGYEGFADGMPQVTESKNPELEKTVRIFPHRRREKDISSHFFKRVKNRKKERDFRRVGRTKSFRKNWKNFLVILIENSIPLAWICVERKYIICRKDFRHFVESVS